VKTKLAVLLAFAGLVTPAVLAGGAGAGQHASFADLTSDLTLRPGVARFGGHPRVNPTGLYGAFDATYYPRNGKLQYVMRWKALRGSALRLVVRSRETGAVYAVLCGPCRFGSAESGYGSRDGRPVTEAKGTTRITRDLAYLMVGGYTFLELDTTVFPSGEIGAPIYGRFFYPGQPAVKGDPRCC
jgi:hypothetical protein